MSEETKRPTLGWSYGGQAVLEGVMMRGAYKMAVAVRRPDNGEIIVKEKPVSKLYRGPISKIPFLRGIPMLWDALGLGMEALFFSAEVVEKAENPDFEMSKKESALTGMLGLGVGLALFMLLPSWIAGLLVPNQPLAFNVVEGLIRLAMLLGYLYAVGQMKEIARVFAYHGAEHKTINAFEDGAPLTVEGVRPYSTAHARCGTAFLLLVAIVSILIFLPFGKPPLLWRLLSRLLAIPVIAGIAYEILRFTGKHAENALVRWLIAPNLALQKLTTREPDDAMLEVAITALKTVLRGEGVPWREA